MILFYFLTSQQDQLRLSLDWKAKQRRTRWPQVDLFNSLVALKEFRVLAAKWQSCLPAADQRAPVSTSRGPGDAGVLLPHQAYTGVFFFILVF